MSEPPVLNHLVSRAFSAVSVAGVVELEQLVNDGMVVSNDRGMLQPRLAEAVPTVENGLWRVFADGRMETTWKIKPAARWHDGTPFLAQDLLFTMKVAADRQVGVFRNTMYDLIESAQAVDDRTVLMRWKSPSIEADTMFTHDVASPMPSHLLGAAFAEDPANLVHHPYWSSQFVGTGAFQLKDWVMGSHLVLKAREAYILGRPRIDEIEVKFIPDTNTMVANVLAGTVALTLGRSVALQEALDVRERSPDTNVLLSFTTWAVMYPQFLHPNPPIIADVRFRRALLHAIDRQEMADTIQQGMVPVGHTFFNPEEPEYRAVEGSVTRYDYDPPRATQLLEELGYLRGLDGKQLRGTELRAVSESAVRRPHRAVLHDHPAARTHAGPG